MSRVVRVAEGYTDENVIRTANGTFVRVSPPVKRIEPEAVEALFQKGEIVRVSTLLMRATQQGVIDAPEVEEHVHARSGRSYLVLKYRPSVRSMFSGALNYLLGEGKIKQISMGVYQSTADGSSPKASAKKSKSQPELQQA